MKFLVFGKPQVWASSESPFPQLNFFRRFELYILAGNFPGSNSVMPHDDISTMQLKSPTFKVKIGKAQYFKVNPLPLFHLPLLKRPHKHVCCVVSLSSLDWAPLTSVQAQEALFAALIVQFLCLRQDRIWFWWRLISDGNAFLNSPRRDVKKK